MEKEIIEAISVELLLKEINKLKYHELVRNNEFVAYNVEASQIPNILLELGRLRELSFRAVGEGTGESYDIDDYDLTCKHVFIWDEKENQIVGAYRILSGKKAIHTKNFSGFYMSTLFHLQADLKPLLEQSLELGRSFIIKKYQKRAKPLMLLWKALTFSVLKTEARYLIGAVSISSTHSNEVISVIIHFLKENFYNKEIANLVQAKIPFQSCLPKNFSEKEFSKSIGKDFNKLDRYIGKLQTGSYTPILIRQYISLLGTQTVAFNVDSNFNNCVDALMIMDLTKAPKKTIESLLKDQVNASAIYERLKNVEVR